MSAPAPPLSVSLPSPPIRVSAAAVAGQGVVATHSAQFVGFVIITDQGIAATAADDIVETGRYITGCVAATYLDGVINSSSSSSECALFIFSQVTICAFAQVYCYATGAFIGQKVITIASQPIPSIPTLQGVSATAASNLILP